MKRFILAALVAASPAVADQPVTITFAAEINGAPFTCSTAYSDIGAAKTRIEISDFRLFVSEASLLRTDGMQIPIALDQDKIWQVDDIALLDFEDGTGPCSNGTSQTNLTLRGQVPDGDYTGLALTVGVPFAANHQDPTLAPSPLNLTSMFWNWRGGYKFVRIEATPVVLAMKAKPAMEMKPKEGMAMDHGAMNHGSGANNAWLLHLGSTMCAAESQTATPSECANPNRIDVHFDTFDPANNTIVIDPARVWEAVDLTQNTPETAAGCMSFPNDPDCTTVLPRLGLAYGDHPASEQVLLSVR